MGKGDSIFACQQETAVFDELAAELDVEPPRYVDIRDRAGWTADKSATGPKMAAIIADTLLEVPPVKSD